MFQMDANTSRFQVGTDTSKVGFNRNQPRPKPS
jgi:hypothetical protein